MASENKNFRTQDLYEAAALYTKGEKLVELDTKRKPYVFVFENYEICNVVSLAYINNELALLAKDYADAIRLLKSRVNTM